MNEDTRSTTQHMMTLEANHDRFPNGNIKLHGYFGFSHEGPWFHNNGEVCEIFVLYDLNKALCERQPNPFCIYLYKLYGLHCSF
jgi:hypothetical protein